MIIMYMNTEYPNCTYEHSYVKYMHSSTWQEKLTLCTCTTYIIHIRLVRLFRCCPDSNGHAAFESDTDLELRQHLACVYHTTG